MLFRSTKAMKAHLMRKGILEVTEAEYLAWLDKQPKAEIQETVPTDQLPPPADEFAEQKKVLEAEKKDKPSAGSLVSSKGFFNKSSKPKPKGE